MSRQPVLSAREQHEVAALTGPARLLVVEDEPRVASFLNKGLRARGFEVEHVSTGLEALAQLEQHGADLVVLDLGLPDIDGLEVMRRLRDSGRRTPVIILTARVEAEDQRAALELGVADYMTKPFSFGDLVERVHAVLDA